MLSKWNAQQVRFDRVSDLPWNSTICVFAQAEKRGLPEPFNIVSHHHRHIQLPGQVPHFWSKLPSVVLLLRVIAVDVVFDLLPEINKE